LVSESDNQFELQLGEHCCRHDFNPGCLSNCWV